MLPLLLLGLLRPRLPPTASGPLAYRHIHTQMALFRSTPEGDDEFKLAKQRNRFYDACRNISAPELISGFAETAPPEVQQAVRTTVISLLGNLPPQLYDTAVTTTGQNMASLMFSMQMTGYMFRNAEYRRSLLQSLEGASSSAALPPVGEVGSKIPDVSGKVTVKIAGTEAEVDASAYMSELRAEVEQLRSQIIEAKETVAESSGGGLLTYIQGLSRDNMASLSSSISEDIMEAMRMLIEGVLRDADVGADTFMETSGVKLRELLVWQLVTGYKLRELEARDELKRSLESLP